MAQFNFLKGTGGEIQRVGVPVGRDDANSSPPEFIQPVLRARPYHPEASAAYLDRETAKRDADNFAELTGREMKVVKDGKLFRLEWRRIT